MSDHTMDRNESTTSTTPDQGGHTHIKMIRSSTLLQRVPYTSRHILNLEKKGLFPKRRQLGPRCVAWVESEIDAWLAARATGPAPAPFPAGGAAQS